MLALSHTTGYAIRALGCLHSVEGQWVLARDIAACTKIPLAYLSKVLQSLSESGLIHSKRGYRGGFALSRPAKSISLLDIVEAVEGERWLPLCLLGVGWCDEAHPCPTHRFWARQREQIRRELARTTLTEISNGGSLHRDSSCGCAPSTCAVTSLHSDAKETTDGRHEPTRVRSGGRPAGRRRGGDGNGRRRRAAAGA